MTSILKGVRLRPVYGGTEVVTERRGVIGRVCKRRKGVWSWHVSMDGALHVGTAATRTAAVRAVVKATPPPKPTSSPVGTRGLGSLDDRLREIEKSADPMWVPFGITLIHSDRTDDPSLTVRRDTDHRDLGILRALKNGRWAWERPGVPLGGFGGTRTFATRREVIDDLLREVAEEEKNAARRAVPEPGSASVCTATNMLDCKCGGEPVTCLHCGRDFLANHPHSAATCAKANLPAGVTFETAREVIREILRAAQEREFKDPKVALEIAKMAFGILAR
jgi:hypothetical protein